MKENNRKIDVLFIHQGNVNGFGPNKILLMPMGLIAMADYLQQNKINSRIIHNLLEREINPQFNIVEKIKNYNASILCIDLHWHHQITPVLNLIRHIKYNVPKAIIIVGGYTASFFYKEIMVRYPQIDYLIKGDAELPLLKLVKTIMSGRSCNDYLNIPNLVFRRNDEIKVNNRVYCLSSHMLSKLNFSNFKLLDNYNLYNRPRVFEGDLNGKKTNNNESGVFFYNCGRGCPYDCLICGGSKKSQEIISNRRKIVYSPINSVIRNLKKLKNYNISTWYNTFDPSQDKRYFLRLFKEIRRNKIRLNLHFECLHIPTEEFIIAAERTFKNVEFEFVLKSGSDKLRKLNKGNFYSNDEIIKSLSMLSKTKIRVNLCLVSGLPFEDKEDIIKTLLFVSFIKNSFKNVSIVSEVLEMEPASPCNLDSNKYEIINYRKSLNDYLRVYQSQSLLGYRTKNFTMKEIYLIKEYYKAESQCKREKSKFLTLLLNSRKFGITSSSEFSLLSLYKFCSTCARYRLCFKSFFAKKSNIISKIS